MIPETSISDKAHFVLLAGEVGGGVGGHQGGEPGGEGGGEQAGDLTPHLVLAQSRHVLEAGVAGHRSEGSNTSDITLSHDSRMTEKDHINQI